MKLYTIGFTKKSAETFFNILKENNVKHLIDVRLNNSSQLAGFAKGINLKYFLKELCDIDYSHDVEFAPTNEMLSNYKKKNISWSEYEEQFSTMLNNRNLKDKISVKFTDGVDGICLLCSEYIAEKCHRRLVAEYIKDVLDEDCIQIIHL